MKYFLIFFIAISFSSSASERVCEGNFSNGKRDKKISKAEEVLGVKLSSSQKRAVKMSYLVGQKEKGVNGALAGIENYTEDQLKKKEEILKQAGFSEDQRRKLIEQGVVGDDLLQRASFELEKALTEIRESSQETHLKEQGFTPEYYRGVDLAREFNEVAKYLKIIEADPQHTHIPYFADQIEKTISDFENSFRQYHENKPLPLRTLDKLQDSFRKNTPEIFKVKLQLLEELKKEARKKVEDKNVTYNWWANLNLLLSTIAAESASITFYLYDLVNPTMASAPSRIILHLIESKNMVRLKNEPDLREKVGIEIEYNKHLVQRIKGSFISFKDWQPEILRESFPQLQKEFEQLNPEEILFEGTYTSQKLEKIYAKLIGRSASRSTLGYILRDLMQERNLRYSNFEDLKIYDGKKALLSELVFNSNEMDNDTTVRANGNSTTFIQAKRKFPEEIMLFTTEEVGIMAFNQLKGNHYPIGISGSPVLKIDGVKKSSSLEFFLHDLGHAISTQEFPQEILERIGNISNKSDREKAELALFIYHHEGLSDVFFDQELKDYYKNAEINLSSSQWTQIEADTKESAHKMTTDDKILKRFLDSNDLARMLPDGVNVNNRKEVYQFLNEAADVFANILLTR